MSEIRKKKAHYTVHQSYQKLKKTWHNNKAKKRKPIGHLFDYVLEYQPMAIAGTHVVLL